MPLASPNLFFLLLCRARLLRKQQPVKVAIVFVNKLKQLASDTLLYGLGNIVPRLLNFVLFPLHTAVFEPAAYGVFTKLMSIVAVLNVVYTFGMETAYFRFASKEGADERRIFNIAQTVVVLISTVFSVVIIVSSQSLATSLDVAGHSDFIVWLAVIMLIDTYIAIPFARLRRQRRPLAFTLYRVSNVVVLVALNFYFLKFAYDPSVGIGYVFLANLIANLLYVVFFFPMLLSWRPAFDKEITPTMTSYAYPVMLTGLAAMTNEFFSRVALEKWLPPNFYPGRTSDHALGVFGGCYKFSVFMSLTVQAFRMAAEPFFFSNASDKNSPALFARVNHYFVIVACFVMLAIAINVDILKHWFLRDPEYWEGIAVIPPLLLGYLLLGIYYNFSVWFKLTDKTYFGTLITAAGAVLTIVLNVILIPRFGYLGSSFATVGVFASMTIACYYWGQKYYPIPYQIPQLLMYVLGTFMVIYLVQAVPLAVQWQATFFHLVVLLAYAMVVWFIERRRLALAS